jgi:hypothetical protein
MKVLSSLLMLKNIFFRNIVHSLEIIAAIIALKQSRLLSDWLKVDSLVSFLIGAMIIFFAVIVATNARIFTK